MALRAPSHRMRKETNGRACLCCGCPTSRLVYLQGKVSLTNRNRTKVLFVCLGNSCRSPMAEAIARRDAADIIDASSAGLTPLGYVAPRTQQTLTENGYPCDGLASKPLLRSAFETADLVVNMSGVPLVTSFQDPAKVVDWWVEDPFGGDEALYQRVFEDLQRRVEQLAAKLRGAGIPSGELKQQETHRP